MRTITQQTIAATLVLAMAFTFNACSGDDNGSDGGDPSISSSGTGVSSSGTETGNSSSSSSGGTGVSSSGTGVSSSGTGIAHAHDWNDWAQTTPATCGNEGEETRTCKSDSLHKETKPIAKIDYNPETHGCSDNQVYILCYGYEYNPATHFCSGNNIYEKCGTSTYNPATQFCYNNSKIGVFCGNNPQISYDPDLYQCKPGINANGIYLKTPVLYQGENYEAVLIGTQTWMAKNLNYNALTSKCYAQDLSNVAADSVVKNCDTYGRLYNWATAMGGAASSSANPSGVQGICPTGWHLPSDAEWTTLTNYISGSDGTMLKATSGWGSNGNGTDTYGFKALPGGLCNSCLYAGKEGFWWSSTERSSDGSAHFRRMTSNIGSSGVYNYDGSSNFYYHKTYLLSIRCVKD